MDTRVHVCCCLHVLICSGYAYYYDTILYRLDTIGMIVSVQDTLPTNDIIVNCIAAVTLYMIFLY